MRVVDQNTKVQRYFSNEEQVRQHFCGPDALVVAFEYVSDKTSHAAIARSILLDPDCEHSDTQLSCLTLILTKEEAVEEARKINDSLLAHKLRHAAQPTHAILLHEQENAAASDIHDRFGGGTDEEKDNNNGGGTLTDEEPKSRVLIALSVYSVPIAYRITGIIAAPADDSSSSLFLVRVVMETHHLACVQGVIRMCNGAMNDFDNTLVASIRKYENKASERAGDPLPVASALAIIAMRKRRQQELSDDIKLLLSSDQVLVNIECADTGEREMTKEEHMMSVLEQTLKHMGITDQTQPITNDEDAMPALVKDI